MNHFFTFDDNTFIKPSPSPPSTSTLAIMAKAEDAIKNTSSPTNETEPGLSSMSTLRDGDVTKSGQSMPPDLANDEHSPTEEEPFRFMDLPREMRDEVLSHLGKDSVIARKTSIELSIKNGPGMASLLVSRQFGREYSESVARHTKLLGRDGCWQPKGGDNNVPDSVEFTKMGFLESITTA
ncbi:hypothetical protein HII31_12430, partial [Pseudocercospora fuligena]